jgi:HEPN domain-containing protein
MDEKQIYWIELAEYDLETAKVMLDGKRYLYVGFMCHQVIEKALKGHYVGATEDVPPYTHNLTTLAKKSGVYDVLSDEQKDLLDTLQPLNIEARYPTHKEKLMKSLSEERCKGILEETEELFLWVKMKLS